MTSKISKLKGLRVPPDLLAATLAITAPESWNAWVIDAIRTKLGGEPVPRASVVGTAAPHGECPYCDNRRAANAATARKRRKRA